MISMSYRQKKKKKNTSKLYYYPLKCIFFFQCFKCKAYLKIVYLSIVFVFFYGFVTPNNKNQPLKIKSIPIKNLMQLTFEQQVTRSFPYEGNIFKLKMISYKVSFKGFFYFILFIYIFFIISRSKLGFYSYCSSASVDQFE